MHIKKYILHFPLPITQQCSAEATLRSGELFKSKIHRSLLFVACDKGLKMGKKTEIYRDCSLVLSLDCK